MADLLLSFVKQFVIVLLFTYYQEYCISRLGSVWIFYADRPNGDGQFQKFDSTQITKVAKI